VRPGAVPDQVGRHARHHAAEHHQTDHAARGGEGEGGEVAAVLNGRDHGRLSPRAEAKADGADDVRDTAVEVGEDLEAEEPVREEARQKRQDDDDMRGAEAAPGSVAAYGRGRLATQVPEVHDKHQCAAGRAKDHIREATLRVLLECVGDPWQQYQAARCLDVCRASAAGKDSEQGAASSRASGAHARARLATRQMTRARGTRGEASAGEYIWRLSRAIKGFTSSKYGSPAAGSRTRAVPAKRPSQMDNTKVAAMQRSWTVANRTTAINVGDVFMPFFYSRPHPRGECQSRATIRRI